MIPGNNEVRIEICTKCNYDCIICARGSLVRTEEIMTTESYEYYIKKVLQDTNQYDTLTFSGFGEPLLDSDFLKKAVIARQSGFKVLLLTNASLLTVDRFKQLNDIGFESIRISFYGINADSYNRVHNVNGRVLFEKVKNNLTEMCKMKRRTKIIFTYNIIAGVNEKDVHDWISYWEPIADLLEVWKPHNWAGGRDFRAIKKERMKTCGRPFNGPLQIQVDGTVNMCCFDYNGKLLLGDLNTQSLTEIFNSDAYKKIVECHLSGNYDGSGLICDICDQRNADKSDVMIYNSKYDINERINKVSTTYADLL